MTKLVLVTALAALSALTGQCASVTITTSTSCITNGGSILDPSSCSSTGVPNGSATAQSSATYSISGNTLTVFVSDMAAVQETVVPGAATGAGNSASAQSSLSIDFVTAGFGPGYVIADVGDSGTGDGRSSSADGGAQSYSSFGNFIGGNMCNSVSGCIGNINYGNTGPYPITLGTDLGVYATASAFANIFTTDTGYNGQLSGWQVSASFEFFKADGTPVDISLATPEPSTWAFLSSGLLCLMVTRLKIRNTRSGVLALLLMIPSLATADTVAITTSTSCATSQMSVSDPSACNLAGTSASASDSYSISGNTLTFDSNLVANASTSSLGNTALASDSLTLDFTTSGPIRNGVMVPVVIATEVAGGSRQLGGGDFFGSAGLGGFGILCQTFDYCATSGMPSYPILLGTNLELTENSHVGSQSYGLQPGTIISGIGALDLSYSFEFFEADGVTPVDISLATPEPSTWAFLSLGLLCVMGTRLKITKPQSLCFLAMSLLTLSSLAEADVIITTSTSCTTNLGTYTDPSACSLAGVPNGSASANASASYSISGNTLTINTYDEATVVGTVNGISNYASAQSSQL